MPLFDIHAYCDWHSDVLLDMDITLGYRYCNVKKTL